MRTLLLSLIVGGMVTPAPPATFTGTIIDNDCAGLGHASMRMAETDPECARACVLSHGSAFMLEAGKDIYGLSDQKTAERLAGQRVIVVGTLDSKTRRIQVESIAPAK
jgi:hypothetical protein